MWQYVILNDEMIYNSVKALMSYVLDYHSYRCLALSNPDGSSCASCSSFEGSKSNAHPMKRTEGDTSRFAGELVCSGVHKECPPDR